ncbi:MAG: SH3 domain-containing protein [Chloroflexota bacterium]|nr:SH3 domain-containing protein [Chloroflexota bacterium]
MRTARITRTRARALSGLLALALVSGAFAPSALASDGGSDGWLGWATVTVANSADGAFLRAEPGFGTAVVLPLAEGTSVELRIAEVDTVLDSDGVTRWWPVQVYGQIGWIAGYYLAPTSEAAAAAVAETGDSVAVTDDWVETESSVAVETETDVAVGPGLDVPTGSTARVSSPDGANLRAEPDAWSEVLAPLAFDAVVDLRISELDTVYDEAGTRWWPVSFQGQAGWVAGVYLIDGGATASSDGVASDEGTAWEETSGEIAAFYAGQYAAASTASGQGVNIRAAAVPDGEPVGFIPEGDVVQVMEGPVGFDGSAAGWYLITDGGTTGYVDSDLLVAAAQPETPTDEAVEDAAESGDSFDAAKFTAGDYAAAQTPSGQGINVRAAAAPDADKVGFIPETGRVQIVAGPLYDDTGNGWYEVAGDGIAGYADGDLLVAAEAPAPDPTPEPTPQPKPEPSVEEARAPAPVQEELAPAPPVEEPAPAPSGPTGGFINPLPGGVVTQGYGCSPYAFEPYEASIGCNFHNGIDLAAAAYTPLLASDGGTVTAAGWCDCGLGFYVAIDHGNGFETVYGHMAEQPYVYVGQVVSQGQVIGPVGSTGLSTGPHVHFILKVGGSTVDPSGYVPIY